MTGVLFLTRRRPKLPRFLKYLQIYVRVLTQEERKASPDQEQELSSLIKWSVELESMWFHMLISCEYNHANRIPFR
jgi:hypothetical protein